MFWEVTWHYYFKSIFETYWKIQFMKPYNSLSRWLMLMHPSRTFKNSYRILLRRLWRTRNTNRSASCGQMDITPDLPSSLLSRCLKTLYELERTCLCIRHVLCSKKLLIFIVFVNLIPLPFYTINAVFYHFIVK